MDPLPIIRWDHNYQRGEEPRPGSGTALTKQRCVSQQHTEQSGKRNDPATNDNGCGHTDDDNQQATRQRNRS